MVTIPSELLSDLIAYGRIKTVEVVVYGKGRSHRERLKEAQEALWAAKESAASQGHLLIKAAEVFRDAFRYNPGHSDLDREQPITITVTLGAWRDLNWALNVLKAREG